MDEILHNHIRAVREKLTGKHSDQQTIENVKKHTYRVPIFFTNTRISSLKQWLKQYPNVESEVLTYGHRLTILHWRVEN